jgi:hypothetical protein
MEGFALSKPSLALITRIMIIKSLLPQIYGTPPAPYNSPDDVVLSLP